jgi:hypothetical protein
VNRRLLGRSIVPLATGVAWVVVAAATARLLVPSNKLLTAGLGGAIAMAAAVAACLGIALLASTRPSRGVLRLSMALALLTLALAGVLIVARAAHETGVVIAAAGLAAGGLTISQLRPARAAG